MALKKNKTLDNGIIVNYHRIVSINNIINQTSVIEVGSYINEKQRNKEKEWYKNNSEEDMNVFIDTTYYSKEYDNTLNVDNAYTYLKTLKDFEGSDDVLEETIETTKISVEPNIKNNESIKEEK